MRLCSPPLSRRAHALRYEHTVPNDTPPAPCFSSFTTTFPRLRHTPSSWCTPGARSLPPIFPYQPSIPYAAFFITAFVYGSGSLPGPKGPRVFFRGHWLEQVSSRELGVFFLRLFGNSKIQIFLEEYFVNKLWYKEFFNSRLFKGFFLEILRVCILYIYMYIKHYERFITRERKEFSLHNCIYNSALHSTLISLTDNKFSIVRSEYIRLRKISRENETNAKNSSRLSSLSTNITVTNFYC